MKLATLLLITLCFCALSTEPAMSLPTEPAIRLQQKSALVGNCDLLIARSGFKMVMNGKEFEMFMVAPKWQLRLVNMRDKLYFDVDPKTWSPREAFTSSLYRSVNFRSLRLLKKEPAELQGLTTTLMHMLGEQYPKNRPLGKWERLAVASADYWGMKDERLTAATIAIMERVYGMPTTGFLPLQLMGLNNKHTSLAELKLVSVVKGTSTATDFQLGKEYRLAKSEDQVVVNSRVGSEITDFAAE